MKSGFFQGIDDRLHRGQKAALLGEQQDPEGPDDDQAKSVGKSSGVAVVENDSAGARLERQSDCLGLPGAKAGG